MGQWGRPAHKGIRHNQKVRGGGTWSAQDRRLKQHMHWRFWRKRGVAETWTSQVRHLDSGARLEWVTGKVLLAGAAIAVLAAFHLLPLGLAAAVAWLIRRKQKRK